MGLTIHCSLQSSAVQPAQARLQVEQLHKRALDLGFRFVGDVVELQNDECDYHKREPADPLRWLLIQAEAFAQHPLGRDYSPGFVTPTHVIAFSTSPGLGSEPANFGLCHYPATTEVRQNDGTIEQVETGLPGWRWSSCCKTQYASNPTCGDVENFLRSHYSIVRLLDHAKELGVLNEVQDESDFWEDRDVQGLIETVGEWNATIAGFVGQMKDLIGDGAESQITKFPNFEHLEAKGREGEVEEE